MLLGNSIHFDLSGVRYQLSGILILCGEPLAKGYYRWHPEKKGKKSTCTQNKSKIEHTKMVM